MMKNAIFATAFLLLAVSPLFSQSKTAQSRATHFSPFTTDAPRGENFSKKVKSATWLRLDASKLKALAAEKPRFLNFEIPGENGQPLRLKLERSEITSPEFFAKLSDGTPVETPVLTYQGSILNSSSDDERSRQSEIPGTMAAVSFSENEVMALVSDEKGQTRVLGKYGDPVRSETAEQYVFYADNQLVESQNFSCGTPDSPFGSVSEIAENQHSSTPPHKDVQIYFEVDNTLFNELGGTATNAILYALGVFNVSDHTTTKTVKFTVK